MRRVALALSALLASSVLTAAPAQAAGDCLISTPSKISINSPYKEVTVKFSGECVNYGGTGDWNVIHPSQGFIDWLWFDSGSYQHPATQKWGIRDWEPLGTWTVRPEGAWDENLDYELWQNERKITVKLSSSLSLSSYRSGKYVTLTSKAKYYSPNSEAYRAWSGATVKFYSKNSDGTWSYRKTATTNSSGVASTTIYSSSTKTWKAVVSASSSKWDKTSSAVVR